MLHRLIFLFPKRAFVRMGEIFLFTRFSSLASLRAFPWAWMCHLYLWIPSAWHRVWRTAELSKCLYKVGNSNSNNISLIKSLDPLTRNAFFPLVGTECSNHILPWVIVISVLFLFLFNLLSHSHMPCPSYDCWNGILFISETQAVSGPCIPSFVSDTILLEQGARDMTHTFNVQ